jgi:hypothetical protein
VLNLIDSKESYYSFSSTKNKLKKENKSVFNQKKWDKINIISTSNEFIILPQQLPESFKKIDFKKTIGTSYSESKTDKLKKLNLTFYQKKAKENKIVNKINHIGFIILNEILSNHSKSKKLYLSILQDKLYICLIEQNNLLFYNQFDFNISNYIKYILLVSDEYELDRKKTHINLLDNTINKNELKKFFNKINLYKKSIFEIIDEYYG